MMKRLVLSFLFSLVLFAQNYKLETITTPPPLPAAYSSLIDAKGYRVVGPSGPWCEVWFGKAIPTGSKPADDSVVLPIAQGTFMGVLNFPGKGADRRGQVIKPGLYTMRYSNFRVDGAHQGVAPQRDFALLTPIASDPDPAAMPDFMTLVDMSRKSGTAHPAVLSLELPVGTTFPAVAKEGESDWSLTVKVGTLTLAIILVGQAVG